MRIVFGCRFYLTLLFACLFMGHNAYAKPGYDVLGVAKYCDTFLKAPKLPAMSTVLNTFGDPLPCVEKRIGKGGLETVQIDPIDCTAQRNGKELPGALRCSNPNDIQKRASTIQPYCSRHPETEFQVTCGLEDDVKDSNLKAKTCAAAKKGCPCCKTVVNSPYSGAKIPGYPIEVHGNNKSGWSVSGDGSSSFDADTLTSDGNHFEHQNSGTFSTYGWWNDLNLRCSGEKKGDFVTPSLRTNRPTLDQFRQMYQVFQPEPAKPAAPKFCKKVREVKGHELVKTNSEMYCNKQKDDGRGNKPLLIIAKPGRRGDKIKVYSSAGKEVGSFGYYGTFTVPGLHRWYMGMLGSNSRPYELYQKLGNEWGFVKLDSTTCLRINAVRRMGDPHE